MKHLLLIMALLVYIVGCDSTPSTYRAGSTGTPYEIFVISTAEEWKGVAGDSLRAVLGRDVEMLNHPQPFFAAKHITKTSLKGLIAKHRNLMMFKISDTVKHTHISADYDINSTPQVVVYLNSQSQDSLAAYLHNNGDKLLSFLDKIEQDRFVARMKDHPAKKINEYVKKTFGFNISIPQGYALSNVVVKDFAWITYDIPFVSQGIIIYTYPLTPDMEFTSDFLVEKRNEFVVNIQGSSEGTFMTTSEYVEPLTSVKNINGHKWIEMKGFWDLKNDFMGGPFVSYTTVDKLNNRVVVIDTYVFSPTTKKGQRNYVKQLEAIVKTATFDSDKPDTTDVSGDK